MARRLDHNPPSEIDEAIAQIGLISRLRLFDAVTP
jgi:2-oxo-4-hydroxy-4-carboxy--5-ureidoimidazoline (OHCU) decarboxylase